MILYFIYILYGTSYIIYCNFYILYFVYYVESDWESRDWTLESEWENRSWTVESGCGSRVTLMTGENESSLSFWDGMIRWIDLRWIDTLHTRSQDFWSPNYCRPLQIIINLWDKSLGFMKLVLRFTMTTTTKTRRRRSRRRKGCVCKYNCKTYKLQNIYIVMPSHWCPGRMCDQRSRVFIKVESQQT